MPVHETRPQWLSEAIESVLSQTYPHWELCIADDASKSPHVRQLLESYAKRDSRVKVTYRERAGHISAATNSALALATGEFISLMDHDDVIPGDALFELVAELNRDGGLDMVYSDEDKIDSKGRRYDPFFKPDWSPDYIESCMYTAHLALYRRTLVEALGGFRSECDGAQDYDFVLRFSERTGRIAHVPRVLYHWRAIPGSTATSMYDKSYVIESGTRALKGRLERTGRTGSVESSRYPGCFDVRFEVAGNPLVSIVIPTAGRSRTVRGRSINLLLHCLQAVRDKSTYRNYEIVIIDNGDLDGSVVTSLERFKCRRITYAEDGFNISRKLNLGADAAQGEFLLFLNDDIEVIRGDWMEAMLEQATKSGVGVVGAKLLYENGTLQHAGVAHHDGLPDHVRKHYSRGDPGYMFSTVAVRNYMAVTGACMLTKAELFRKAGGFHEGYKVNYGDIDYCLKVREMGYRCVYTPHAELYHFESASREAVVDQDEIDLYRRRWGAVTKVDPYYNGIYLRTNPPDFTLDLPE